MKSTIISMLLLFTLISCEKEYHENKAITKKDLLGKWVNLTEIKDTLNFTDSILYRERGVYFYKYTIYDSDSLKLDYKGKYKIKVSPAFLKMNLNSKKDTLEIKDLHTYFPEKNGDIFKKNSN